VSANSVLLLDIGNSRLKWALLHGPHEPGQPFAATGVLELAQLANQGALLLRLLEQLDPGLSIEACNVAGASIERQLRAIVRQLGLRAPHFVRSARSGGGVRNAYARPWRLGADRWSALIGARSEYPGRALCLVAIGTAMTIDLLDAKGRHRGGSIIPGPKLMIEALLEHTAGIRRRAGGRSAADAIRAGRARLFARDTRSAVVAGAVHAAAALVSEAMRSARVLLGSRPRLILSGGAAELVGSLLREPHRCEQELALRGLAVLRSART
jgi:type III pantothenate kinase